MQQVENAMVVGGYGYRGRQKEPRFVAVCSGCHDDIYDDEEHWLMEDGEVLHDDYDCIMNWIRHHAVKI